MTQHGQGRVETRLTPGLSRYCQLLSPWLSPGPGSVKQVRPCLDALQCLTPPPAA